MYVPLLFKIILNTTFIMEYEGLLKLNVIFVILIAFLNKGIYFIYMNSILKDKNVVKHIPQFFKNNVIPAICYSY